LFITRFLGVDISGSTAEELRERYEEAQVMREYEVGVVQEAVVRAFNKGKRK
jgi:hypothetical protein